jgi:hypothetical protein
MHDDISFNITVSRYPTEYIHSLNPLLLNLDPDSIVRYMCL